MSSSFYTQQVGHKFSIRVHANGYGNSKDKHISVYVHQMLGEYDDQLVWPFIGKFDIELLNWRNDEEHHKMTLSIVAWQGFVKVTEGIFGKLLGFEDFIAHSSLAYDPIRNTEYLQEDCLRFRVNVNTE